MKRPPSSKSAYVPPVLHSPVPKLPARRMLESGGQLHKAGGAGYLRSFGSMVWRVLKNSRQGSRLSRFRRWRTFDTLKASDRVRAPSSLQARGTETVAPGFARVE